MSGDQRSYTYEEYLKTMKLFERGFGLTEACRKLSWPTTRKSTLYYWKHGLYKPPTTRWIPEPTKELAYIIGVLHGDAYINKHGSKYDIVLNTIDYEFAEKFSKVLAKTLDKKYFEPKFIGIQRGRNYGWKVAYSSKSFYIWYKKHNLDTLKPFIEHDEDTVACFLRGLYDSDGGHYKHEGKYNRISLFNSNLKLLKYTQHLLKKYFNIITIGPYLGTRAGTILKKNGKKYIRKKDVYHMGIYRKQYIEIFLNKIGFSITEKQLGLPRRKK